MKKFLIILFFSLFLSSSVYAYTTKGEVECATIIKYHKQDEELTSAMMTAYVNGYITGRNYENDADDGVS